VSTKKIIFITGAGSGLGKKIAQTLSKKGHRVYGSYFSSRTAIKNKRLIRMDVRSAHSVKTALQKVIKIEGRINILINNAGATISGLSNGNSERDFRKMLEVNVLGPFRVIKEALRSAKKPEMIINITSMSAFLSLPNFAIYSSSKHAMEAFGLALRYELWPKTKVVNVTPGALVAKRNGKISHKTARAKFPILNWLMPLTSYDRVSGSVALLVNSASPPKRLVIGRDANIISIMQRVLPDFLFDRIMLFIWLKN